MKQYTENTPTGAPPCSCETPTSLFKQTSGPASYPDEPANLPLGTADFLATAERRLITSCPHAGGGVHDWTFKVLCVLSTHYSDDTSLFEAARTIFDEFATRRIPDGEIFRQIGNARRYTGGAAFEVRGSSGGSFSPAWPLPDIAAIESIVRSGPLLGQLQSALPACPKGRPLGSLEILQLLFPKDPLLCCGRRLWSAQTLNLSKWDHLDECQFIVPSPMTNTQGVTCDGKSSTRCLSNTGPRHFLVIEFDFKVDDAPGLMNGISSCRPPQDVSMDSKSHLVSRLSHDGFTVLDICSTLIHHLAFKVHPALVVHSGGKSLHAWFPCMGVEDDRLKPFMRYAVQMGADRATWSRCQFVRMPGGLRDNGTRQAVLYFNPEVLP